MEERDYYKAQVEYLKKAISKSTRGGEIKQTLRCEIIYKTKSLYSITWLVEITQVKRSGYYKWVKTMETHDEKDKKGQVVRDQILAIHLSHREFGYPRITL
ncbi:hypothetical protein [Peribacillus deserti]|uniref:hypothetical protein n=1 Tax=Peribacillus deserti TaxID=673318 RepID=UPI0015E11C42|nr:hypothetical protein [Peribacillus deserti]